MTKRALTILAIATASAFALGVVMTAALMTGSRLWLAGEQEVGAGTLTGADRSADSATPTTAGPDVGLDPDGTASPAPASTDSPLDGQQPVGTEGVGAAATATAVSCPSATVTVTDGDSLEGALVDATAGDVIVLSDGLYEGEFRAAVSGTADAPIFLCGSSSAVLDGDGHAGGYVMHLDGARYWRLIGFTVQNGQKGVMADGTVGSLIQGLTIHSIGDEALHLRRYSTDNTVIGNTIYDTGNRREKYGEGIYVGTAKSNWCDITDCQPDRSDRNLVEGNVIYDVSAEAVDIKEGTTGGTLRGNTFDGSGMTGDGGDSWVDVKGNNWIVEDNAGVNSTMDGFQVHQILDGWGKGNRFRDNNAAVNGPGFGFSFTPVQDNVVECSNVVSAAKEGYANVSCR